MILNDVLIATCRRNVDIIVLCSVLSVAGSATSLTKNSDGGESRVTMDDARDLQI